MAFIHGKGTVVVLNGYDMSQYVNKASIGATLDAPDVTTFGKNAHVYLPGGVRDGAIGLEGFWTGPGDMSVTDTSVDKLWSDALSASAAQPVLTIGLDNLTINTACRMAQLSATAYSIESPFYGVVATTFEGQATAGVGVDLTGRSLVTPVSSSATANGTSVDNTAATTNGGVAHLHVTVNARTAATTFKVQHSSDNAAWVDLATFASVATIVLTGERVTVAAGTTVNRYLRGVITIGSGTGAITWHISMARR